MNSQDTLSRRFSYCNRELSESEIVSLAELLGKGCQQKTKAQLFSILRYGRHTIKYVGIFDRVYFVNGEAHYCAGQSRRDEIRTVRNCILGR